MHEARHAGEFALIRRLQGVLGDAGGGVPVGIGDDAAVLAPDLVWSLDVLVEDVHFRARTIDPASLGWKALAVNLSDLAAMGAAPVAALVGLTVGPGWGDAALAELYAGLRDCGEAFGCPVVGGDVVRGPALQLAVSVLGRTPAPALRGGAVPGDLICVTGPLGGSAAGFVLLEGRTGYPPGGDGDRLIAGHRRPQPRLAEGAALAPLAHALLDLSDGVAQDALRLAEASGVTVEIDLDRLPLADGVAEVAAALGTEPGAFAATGGEDYELLCAVPPAVAAAPPVPLTPIGRVVAGPIGVRFLGRGADGDLRGWDHLAGA